VSCCSVEVALIVSMMLAGGPGTATLPRDTIYAAVMIICTGVVGICLLAGGLRHHAQSFRLEGTNGALSALVALTGLSLVLPTFTTSSPEGTYTASQLVFAAVSSLALWAIFVFLHTVRHRDDFLPPSNTADEAEHAAPPSAGVAAASFGLTVPAVVATTTLLDLPLVLGLPPKDLVLLALTFLVGAITLGTGRTNMMQGAVHLVLFAAFVFLPLVP